MLSRRSTIAPLGRVLILSERSGPCVMLTCVSPRIRESGIKSPKKNLARYQITLPLWRRVPEGSKAITGRWVFRRKVNEHIKLVRAKSRVVIRGFLQELS